MMNRRNFLTLTAAGWPLLANGKKSLRGIFPIMQTPFTESNNVDFPVLAKEVHFLDRCGVHGMVWPQLASEWSTLAAPERMEGMEAISSVARGIRPAIVFGVQAPELRQAVQYARKATELRADALIAIPQGKDESDEVVSYYRAIGEASPLPLFIQAVGKVSVDFVIRLAKEVPTLRYIKDESGPVTNRVTEFRRRAPEMSDFTGSHGKVMYEEMMRGSAGNMPASGWADLYAAAWDAFAAGDRRRAARLCGLSLLFVAEAEQYGLEAVKYALHARGVFPNWRVRGQRGRNEFDDEARRAIRDILEQVKVELKA